MHTLTPPPGSGLESPVVARPPDWTGLVLSRRSIGREDRARAEPRAPALMTSRAIEGRGRVVPHCSCLPSAAAVAPPREPDLGMGSRVRPLRDVWTSPYPRDVHDPRNFGSPTWGEGSRARPPREPDPGRGVARMAAPESVDIFAPPGCPRSPERLDRARGSSRSATTPVPPRAAQAADAATADGQRRPITSGTPTSPRCRSVDQIAATPRAALRCSPTASVSVRS